MAEDKIKNLLRQTDRVAGRPAVPDNLAATIRQRAKRKRFVILAPMAAAAVILIALGIWAWTTIF